MEFHKGRRARKTHNLHNMPNDLKKPAAEGDSPWGNIVSSTPKPPPVLSNNWMNQAHYPLVKPEHAEDLEREAAINEFGLKMTRPQAEHKAYADYQKGNRIQAAKHHLAGAEMARTAGNMEAAAKHGAMYDLHVKALGHDPAGPVPEPIAQIPGNPKAYKFRAHPGDLFAVHPENQGGLITSAPPPK